MYDRCDICAQILHTSSEPRQPETDRQNWSVDVSGYGNELRLSADPDEQDACETEHQCYGLGVEVGQVLYERSYDHARREANEPLWTHRPCSMTVVR